MDGVVQSFVFKLKKSSGYCMYHKVKLPKTLRSAHTEHFSIRYGPKNKRRLFSYASDRFRNRDGKCLLCDTIWVFKRNRLTFVLRGCIIPEKTEAKVTTYRTLKAVRSPIRMDQLGSQWTGFDKSSYLRFFTNICS
jgi:hypothetical protein